MRRPDPQHHSFLLSLSAGILIPGFLFAAQMNPKLESAYTTAPTPSLAWAQQQNADAQANAHAQAETPSPREQAIPSPHDLTDAHTDACADWSEERAPHSD
jgi:hypothetical protein